MSSSFPGRVLVMPFFKFSKIVLPNPLIVKPIMVDNGRQQVYLAILKCNHTCVSSQLSIMQIFNLYSRLNVCSCKYLCLDLQACFGFYKTSSVWKAKIIKQMMKFIVRLIQHTNAFWPILAFCGLTVKISVKNQTN